MQNNQSIRRLVNCTPMDSRPVNSTQPFFGDANGTNTQLIEEK